MKKIFAIGTLLLSSAAVFASPAAAYDRDVYVNRAPVVRVDHDRDLRLRQERERRERELREIRYRNSLRGRC